VVLNILTLRTVHYVPDCHVAADDVGVVDEMAADEVPPNDVAADDEAVDDVAGDDVANEMLADDVPANVVEKPARGDRVCDALESV